MNVKSLDGKDYKWSISEKIAKGNRNKTSNLHQLAKHLLRQYYPNLNIYEEVPIKISSGRGHRPLYLDFYIPSLLLAVEVNGKQHYEYSNLFHKTKLDFLKGKVNDNNKEMWCTVNDIELIVFKYNEVDTWETQL